MRGKKQKQNKKTILSDDEKEEILFQLSDGTYVKANWFQYLVVPAHGRDAYFSTFSGVIHELCGMEYFSQLTSGEKNTLEILLKKVDLVEKNVFNSLKPHINSLEDRLLKHYSKQDMDRDMWAQKQK